MANERMNSAYGLSEAIIGLVNQPIISRRNPTANDKAPIGTAWINRATNAYFVITSIVSNAATWATGANSALNFATTGTLEAGTSLTVGTTATIGTGLTVTAGGILVNAGGATITGNVGITGTLQTTSTITADAGAITATAGNVVCSTDATGLVLAAGQGVIADGNDLDLSVPATGNITATLGDAAGANFLQVKDSAAADVFTVDSNGVGYFAEEVRIDGDTSGVAGATTFTGTVNGTAISTGVGSVKMTTVNAADNTGWIKIYIGTDARWIPYWTDEVS